MSKRTVQTLKMRPLFCLKTETGYLVTQSAIPDNRNPHLQHCVDLKHHTVVFYLPAF